MALLRLASQQHILEDSSGQPASGFQCNWQRPRGALSKRSGSIQRISSLDSDPDTYTNLDLVPVQVVVGQAALAINAIRPGSSDFTITSRSVLYWKGDDCNQTEAQRYACKTRLGEGKGLRFLVADDSLGAPQVHLSLSQPNIHAAPFIENGAEALTYPRC